MALPLLGRGGECVALVAVACNRRDDPAPGGHFSNTIISGVRNVEIPGVIKGHASRGIQGSIGGRDIVAVKTISLNSGHCANKAG